MAAAALLRMHERGIRHSSCSNPPTMAIPIATVLPHISLLLPQISGGITVVLITMQVSSLDTWT